MLEIPKAPGRSRLADVRVRRYTWARGESCIVPNAAPSTATVSPNAPIATLPYWPELLPRSSRLIRSTPPSDWSWCWRQTMASRLPWPRDYWRMRASHSSFWAKSPGWFRTWMGFSISGSACRCRATARRKPGNLWKSCSKRITAFQTLARMAPRSPARTPDLFALEDESDRLVLRPHHADHHGAIRGQGVAFESNRAGLRGGHLQHVVIPPGLALEVF